MFEEILAKAPLLNSLTVFELLSESLPMDEVLKNIELIIIEIDSLLAQFDDVKKYVSYTESLPTIAMLGEDILILNRLSHAYKQLVADEFSVHTGIKDITELLNSSTEIEKQKDQINTVLMIIGEKGFSQNDFYKNLEKLNSEIGIWKSWYVTYLETKEARRRIKNVPYRVKATKAKQPEPEIEVEDDLVIDDDDLDLIDRGDR